MGKYSCEACKKKCKKEAIHLQDKYFHVACFTCKECKKPLATDGFYTKDGAHFCAADYQRLFGTKCYGCGKVVEGEVMTVLGKTYHQECFRCSMCRKAFLPGEKATFGINDEHWCHSCQVKHQQQQQKLELEKKAAAAASAAADIVSAVPAHVSSEPAITVAVEVPASPLSPDKNGLDDNRITDRSRSPTVESSKQITEEPKEAASVVAQRKPSNPLPRVFGMPENKFYNMSYLERSNSDFKRGPSVNAVAKEPAVLHYHRPNNFSYTNLRKDFKSELGVHGHKDKELVLLSRRPDGQMKPLAPIERDDWPGPPEPAAAYPELLRGKASQPKSPGLDETVNTEDEKVNKEIDELSKMTDSGAAAVILRDLKKKRSESPTLDPRNSSMAPSAALEPLRKPRYEQPFFASASRNLDMRQRILQEQSRRSVNESLLAPNNFGGVVKSTHGLSILRPGSSFDARNGYQSDGFELQSRPKSSAGILQSHSLEIYDERGHGDVDPVTGLRHSYQLKAATLQPGLTGHYFLDNVNLLSPSPKEVESPKIFPYDLLCQKNFDNLVGVNKDALERHLSKDEFEKVFQMPSAEFNRLPVWQRNEAKLKVGLM